MMPEQPRPTAGRRRTLLIAGGGLVLVVAIGVVLALAGSSDTAKPDAPGLTVADTPAFGPVTVDGTPLPRFTSTADDPAIDTAAPVLQGRAADGTAVSVGGAGRPTMIAFLAHWCPHCQRELPLLVQLMARGDLHGVRVVAVLTGTNPDAPNFPPVAWLRRARWKGDVLLDDDTTDAALSYGLSSYPFLVFLDSKGNVVARTVGELPAKEVVALADQIR